MKTYNVYCIKEKSTNKIVYIGMTSQKIEVRFYKHCKFKNISNNTHEIKTIKVFSDKQEACSEETRLIYFYNTVLEGLNITYGKGCTGLKNPKGSFTKGNKLGEKGTKKILCVETNLVYNSITECAGKMKLSISKISAVANGKRKSTGGFSFKFLNEERLNSDVC